MQDVKSIVSKLGTERNILSILVKSKNRVVECSADNVYAEHFSLKANQIIYSILVYLSQDESISRFDSTLIYNQITSEEAKKALDEAGGMDYLEALFLSPTMDNLSFYTKQLKDTALLRQVYKVTEEMQDDIINFKSNNTEELLNKFQERILDISINQADDSEIKIVGKGLREKLEQEQVKGILGYELGWANWDRVTQGLQPNDLTVICAESKTGKSTMLINMSIILSYQYGMSGLYIDTEMTTEEQEYRILACLSGVPFEELRNGKFKEDTIYGQANEKINKVEVALRQMEANPIHHVYMPTFNADKISALVRRYKIQHNIGYFVFDYLKISDGDVKSLQSAQEYQRLGFLTSSLKNLAGICQIPCITACQSNRSAVGNTSMDANQIGGSYRILQLATRLCFLRRKQNYEMAQEGYNKGNMVLKIAYQRHGSSDGVEFDFQFDFPILRFSEIGLRGDSQ